jgi:CheY-like chemotaxis protein
MKTTWDYNWKGKSILIVEDDPINFNYLDFLLKSTRAKIYHAERGEDALDLLKRKIFFDIVLMDIRLPGISGLETTRKILSLRNGQRIIAQTAYAAEEDREAAFSAGCCDFIAKPIRANEMLDLIRRYLDGQSDSQKVQGET